MQTLITKSIHEKLIANHLKGIEVRSNLDDNGDEYDIDFMPALKLFCPWNNATWLISELDPETNIGFGLADLGMGSPELGYIPLNELIAFNTQAAYELSVNGFSMREASY